MNSFTVKVHYPHSYIEALKHFKKRLTDGGFLVPSAFREELLTLSQRKGSVIMDLAKSRLGMKYRDKVTGFEGVATGYVQYLSGCNQILLVPHAAKNEFMDGQWLDEQRLEKRPGKRVTLDNAKSNGFDR